MPGLNHIVLAALVLACVESVLYTHATGFCTGGLSPDHDSGSREYSDLSCKKRCNTDTSCSGYALNNLAHRCKTYTSPLLETETSPSSSYAVCFIKETDYTVTMGVCQGWAVQPEPSNTYRIGSYPRFRCIAKCEADPACTGFTFSTMAPDCDMTSSHGIEGNAENLSSISGTFLKSLRCAARKNIKYTLFAKTQDVASAGTNVINTMKWKITGAKLSVYTPPGEINDPARNDLERNTEDKYTFMMPDVGEVQSITIFADTKGDDNWCPEYIHMVTEFDPIPMVFRNWSRRCVSRSTTYGVQELTLNRDY